MKNEKAEHFSGLAITGFVLSFFGILAFLGIIFSAIGISQTKDGKKRGRGLAIAGLVISILTFLFSVSVLYGIGQAVSQLDISPDTKFQDGNSNISVSNSSSGEKLNILSHKMATGDFGTLSVTGVAENVAGKTLDYAQIDVKFYDSDGALLGTSFANINGLEAGEKWKFEAIYLDMDSSNVDSYKIGVGSTW